MLMYIASACVATVVLLYYYLTRTFNYWKDRNVAYVQPVPLFGNLKDSALRKKYYGVIFKEIYEQFPNEKVVGMYRMTSPCLLIIDLDIVKNILIKDFDAFGDRGVEFSKDGLGANLFHADIDTWRLLRTRFTPIFTAGKMRKMLHLIIERSDKFMQYLDTINQTKQEHELHSLFQMFTTSAIAACAFGLDLQLTDKVEALAKLDKAIFTPNFVVELDMMYPGVLKKLNSSLFPVEVKKYFDNIVSTVIAQRNGMPTKRNDFMDLVLELRQEGEIQGVKRNEQDNISLELTEGVIAAQVFVFYVAGYETSSTTMSFMAHVLAHNPDVQDKLIAEIDDTMQLNDGKITYESLKEMTYLSKVFDETLRMYPIVEPLQRMTKVNYKIPGTDVTIEKGQMTYISVLGIHYDEKYYPDPYTFDPERFTAENSAKRHPCAYLPFGIGPRNCIGMRFGKAQAQVGIVRLLSKFRLEPSKYTKRNPTFIPNRLLIGPDGGVNLKLVPRR